MLSRPRSSRAAMLMLILIWSASMGYALVRLQLSWKEPLRPFEPEGLWIASPDRAAFTGYFRTEFMVTGQPKHAWIVVSARNAFEVTVNRNPVGRIYLWRPTRPYQNGTSDPGQRITHPEPVMALNFPREYQWSDHDNARVPLFIDLSEYIRPGRNVIGVQVEARHPQPSFQLSGAVELWSGEVIPIQSNPSWRAEPVPPGLQTLDWTEPNYVDAQWRTAITVDPPHRPRLRTLPPRTYSTPFRGDRIADPRVDSDQAVVFATDWELPKAPDEAFLRVFSNRPFDLTINGTALGPTIPSPLDLDRGNWIINERRAWDPFSKPELLDPDEIGSLFVGKDFLNPRHSDPTYDPVEQYRNMVNVTPDQPRATNRSDLPGTYDPKTPIEETRRTPEKPDRFPEPVPPKSLTRDRSELAYYAYTIGPLLKAGSNRIEIRLAEPWTVEPPNWGPRLAIDGEATLTDGRLIPLESGSDWFSHPWMGPENTPSWQSVQTLGPALTPDTSLPRLTYRGRQNSAQSYFGPLINAFLGVLLVTIAAGVLVSRNPRWSCGARAGLILATTIVLLTLGLDLSFYERHEHLQFLMPWPWLVMFGAVGTALATGFSGAFASEPGARSRTILQKFRNLPSQPVWSFLISWILIASAFLRIYKLDYQPLDDDEYASVQAVLAIARTGVPEFEVEGVYYTRSPLYHYLAAIFVLIFGENLWALRGPVAMFGVGTVWLTYRYGAKVLRSPWVGLGAMVLMAVHPFTLFTGHVSRFYQQQQFFAILTAYWFCKGFVTDQDQSRRELTVLAFLCAVLSQEITMVAGPQLALGFLLFARDLGFRANLRLVAAGGIAMACIFIDWLAFQTLCLTRTEGVSPNLEATVKPHFWQPLAMLSLIIGYSRLHILLSVFPLLDLVLRWRTHNRAFIATVFLLVSGVVMTVVLVTHPGLRYQYFLLPLWILVGVEGIRRVAVRLSSLAGNPSQRRHRPGLLAVVLSAVMFTAVLLSWSLWRVPGSYDLKLLPDSTGAFRYVAAHLREGDHVLATEPHPHAGILEIGRIDYDLSVPRLLDFLVLKDGQLIDRNGGAVSIGNLDELMDACEAHDRLWLLIYKEKFRTRGKNMRWEYPGARIETFIRQNMELKHQTYLWHVYLWDRSQGHFRPFRPST
ncbi:glycosyltransferase family 39 protein [Tautonia rosea]|uniref:glycosyltransferase family 39 protein n=1 Tax=Tautonia rosea TaxID=2728037 RepID=UPI001473AF61|nr:glycosyltransferase family 39 protein [Tautonia rosea]